MIDDDRLPRRFWKNVRVATDGCWLWVGQITKAGYGHFVTGKRKLRAHRCTYEALIGAVPDGMELDHLCRVRRCCNPLHLEPVTHAENMHRSSIATKTHCKNGHPFSEENTYKRPEGGRRCRACNADAASRYQDKKRSAA